ncbi:MAG: hypothetical protein H7Y89_16830 [Steroidobacteraceae bacterium]|nr:hypothetical protein [Steroidobacteraceae bacterium]
MNDKRIEARLEKSLRAQVKAPRLEKRFDAAVWARIDAGNVVKREAEPASTNWLFVFNGIGIGVAFVLLCVFGVQSLSGLGASAALPEISVAPATMKQVGEFAAQAIAVGAVVFGLMFTPWGRRLRAEFS